MAESLPEVLAAVGRNYCRVPEAGAEHNVAADGG